MWDSQSQYRGSNPLGGTGNECLRTLDGKPRIIRGFFVFRPQTDERLLIAVSVSDGR